MASPNFLDSAFRMISTVIGEIVRNLFIDCNPQVDFAEHDSSTVDFALPRRILVDGHMEYALNVPVAPSLERQGDFQPVPHSLF